MIVHIKAPYKLPSVKKHRVALGPQCPQKDLPQMQVQKNQALWAPYFARLSNAESNNTHQQPATFHKSAHLSAVARRVVLGGFELQGRAAASAVAGRAASAPEGLRLPLCPPCRPALARLRPARGGRRGRRQHGTFGDVNALGHRLERLGCSRCLCARSQLLERCLAWCDASREQRGHNPALTRFLGPRLRVCCSVSVVVRAGFYQRLWRLRGVGLVGLEALAESDLRTSFLSRRSEDICIWAANQRRGRRGRQDLNVWQRRTAHAGCLERLELSVSLLPSPSLVLHLLEKRHASGRTRWSLRMPPARLRLRVRG